MLFLIIPIVVLDKYDDKVLRDHSNDSTGHVHHWDRRKLIVEDLSETPHLAYTFDDLHLLRSLLEEILDTKIFVFERHMISEQWHLLSPDRVFVETSVASFGDAE